VEKTVQQSFWPRRVLPNQNGSPENQIPFLYGPMKTFFRCLSSFSSLKVSFSTMIAFLRPIKDDIEEGKDRIFS